MVLDLDRELAKDRRRRLLVFLVLFLIFLFVSGISFFHITRSSPSLQIAWGEVEIFSDGIWIPLGSGVDIRNIEGKRLRVKGEVVIAGKRIRSKDAVVKIEQEKIRIISGKVEVVLKDRKIEVEKGETFDIASLRTLSEGRTETEPEKQAYLKSITINVSGKVALVEIVAPGTRNVMINGVKFLSEDEGIFKVQVPLDEGENTLHILGFDKNERIVFTRTEKIFIDTTPPEIKSLEMFWE